MSQKQAIKFAASLKRRMNLKGISWRELSEKSRVAAGTVSMFKNDYCTNPCLCTMAKLADAVGCHIEVRLKYGKEGA
jgi:transcriptional regulator with XRE-family HTH domain